LNFNRALEEVTNLVINTLKESGNVWIAKAGLDFSDVSETCWIFGYDYIKDVLQFFDTFTSKNY